MTAARGNSSGAPGRSWRAVRLGVADAAGRLALIDREAACRDDGDWFFVDLDDRTVEIAWREPDEPDEPSPLCLDPSVFPGGQVPWCFGELLAASNPAAVAAIAAGSVSAHTLGCHLDAIVDVLVPPEERAPVVAAVVDWLERIASGGDRRGGAPAEARGPGPDEPADGVDSTALGTEHLASSLRPWRVDLDRDVARLAVSARLDRTQARASVVGRLAHVQVVRLWGVHPGSLGREIELWRARPPR